MSEGETTLLPPTATDIAKALDLLEGRIGQLPVDVITKDPAHVPVAMLDALAWELSVDDWDTDWSEARKREVLLQARDVHQHKGTPYGVKRAIEAMGYGTARLTEGWEMPRLGGAASHGSAYSPSPLGIGWVLGGLGKALGLLSVGPQRALPLGREWVLGWDNIHVTDYWVSVTRLISRRDADALALRLQKVAPVRCRLRGIALAGVRHELGVGVWTLGANVPLGGVFKYEVNTNG